MEASEEQKQIIKVIKENNVIVDSVAGSGKNNNKYFYSKRISRKKNIIVDI